MSNQESQPTTDKSSPPYLPYRTFSNFIDGLRVGIPGRIDRSVLHNLSGTAQSMLIGTLRFFKLISPDGTPTEMLGKLVRSESVDRQKLLRELLRVSYPFMFSGSINIENATPRQVHEAFANAGVSGDTVRKAAVFFYRAAKEADIPLSQHLKIRPPKLVLRRRTGIRTNASKEIEGEFGENTAATRSGIQKTPYEMLINILNPEAMDEQEQMAVWTLIRYLKKQESGEGS